MPIRLNLLAEAQAAEEMRRRDPVKRAIWAAALLIALMLVWSSFLQLRATLAGSDVTRLQAQMSARTNQFLQVLDNQAKTREINGRLSMLRQFTTNRFLNGNLLNALQQTSVEDVQLIGFQVGQFFTVVPGTKPTKNEDDGVVTPGRPASTTERTVLTLEGIDASPNPGDQVGRFKAALAANAYFKTVLVKTNAVSLKSLSAPQLAPLTGKPCVMFTLECRFPEKSR